MILGGIGGLHMREEYDWKLIGFYSLVFTPKCSPATTQKLLSLLLRDGIECGEVISHIHKQNC